MMENNELKTIQESLEEIKNNYNTMEEKYTKSRKQFGITLIALVITMIVLLIIAGITVAQLSGNGLFDRTKLAKEKYKNSENTQDSIISQYQEEIEKIGSARDVSLDKIYPVGSIYITTSNENPSNTIGGTWQQIEEGRVLQTVKTSQTPGTIVDAGLPNIYGSIGRSNRYGNNGTPYTGLVSGTLSSYYLTHTNNSSGSADRMVEQTFDASKSNSIYGNSDTVQPPAYLVYMWKRTA